uniref:Exonuclease domain-containing protein n=1 Tax=Strigamia maritima TaxID=126957 RepID=T1IVF4_STRMM
MASCATDYVVPSKQLKDYGYPSDFNNSTAYIEPKSGFNNTSIQPLNIGVYDPCTFASNQITLRNCCRCRGQFFVNSNGDYLSLDPCVYHWGKLSGSGKENKDLMFSCCNGPSYTPGCTLGRLHVSLGATSGYLSGFVSTKPAKNIPKDDFYGIYAVDCEMCYTTQGLDLVKVSLVRPDGSVAYDELVKPVHPIIDYNTRFSGMTEKKLRRATKSLKEVQKDLLELVHAETILIGHSLENDLRVLRLAHSTVVDTSVLFPHFHGLPFRRSLKSLISCVFKKDIQSCVHNSVEDARASLELVLWRLRKDLK